MSLQLIDPISSMPFFQPNQVLTFSHLNNLAAYLYEQERYTRNKLIGSGIVCGLTFSWTSAGGNNAMVMIDDGIAITSAGYLIVFKQPVPYTYKRKFTRLQDFEPFSELNIPANTTIYELITQDEYDAETEVPKSVLIDADKKADNNIDRVLILLFDIQTLNIAKCLDENCDDKGKIYEYTPRPLLVPKNIIDAIVNADDTKDYYTEEGCGWKHRDQTNFNITYLGVP
ncbi:MAG: hypothetical protein JO072_16120, partial [Parafilimonas sp.]|nr:hypothetical protein [Parafilimonas sp.]